MKINYYNDVLAGIAATYVKGKIKSNDSARIRIIEVGAGTGGTSAAVLQQLNPLEQHIEEYCYTDLSKAFLLHAEKEYGHNRPFMNYKTFDVQYPPAGQDIPTGNYDIVIAANVLHATKNMRETIRNVKAVLKHGGILLLIEISGNSLFTHLTFGLLEGWWLYEDPELRIPGCPGLTPESWHQLLLEEGFQSVYFPAEDTHKGGQQVIVAESDGIVTQVLKDAPFHFRPDDRRPSSPAGKASHPPEVDLHLQDKYTYFPTATQIEEHVKEIITEMLSESLKVNIALIDPKESFSDYGVDSITGVRLIQSINNALSISLQVANLFDYSSVNQLVAFIINQYKDRIAHSMIFGEEKSAEEDNPQRLEERPGEKQDHLDHSVETYPPLSPAAGRKVCLPETETMNPKEDVAIIGISGRFPQSDNVHALWENLAFGKDLIEKVTRWDLSLYYGEGASYCKYGGFLKNIDQFDPQFFNISGTEALHMDPHQRIFLEECWKALEDAGYAGESGESLKCGVYVGFNELDYRSLLGSHPAPQAFWGNASSVIPARIAYYLNLQGPAIAVDTACSSSLVSIHLACQGLWCGETDMSLAGGVFLQSTPGFFLASNRAGMLSPSGKCYTFDKRADGFVPGEGAGVVVLKRLKDALHDGDTIYGVIRGTAINQDGATNGITAPSAKSQENLLREVYDRFSIDPADIQMVEAHGTGTKLGDPIEYSALVQAFRGYTDRAQYCAIGSIKTNIGHAAAAAGIAGLIKVLLSLKHKQIPPSLHFKEGNEHISFAESPFYVNTEIREWTTPGKAKRMAAISAFGFSGTNAHMVVEEAPVIERAAVRKPKYLIVLSAQTQAELRTQAERLIAYCRDNSGVSCWDMSFTLLLGRKHMNCRLTCVVRNQNELIKILDKWLEKGASTEVQVTELDNTFCEQPSLKRYGNECLQACSHTSDPAEYTEQLSASASLYLQGYELDFKLLFVNEPAGRIPLPVYPFSKERYWLDAASSKYGEIKSHTADKGKDLLSLRLHPLLHRNTSDFTELRFSSVFDGTEYFLADHVLQGQKLFPGVAYLEMARSAVELASGINNGEELVVELKHVGWFSPMYVGQNPVQVHVSLDYSDDGEIQFRIYGDVDNEDKPIVYSQGRANYSKPDSILPIDLDSLRSQFNKGHFTASACYGLFEQMGLHYGANHQGIEELFIGNDCVMAKLTLPAEQIADDSTIKLHPGLADSALQAAIGFQLAQNEDSKQMKPFLPFALQGLKVLSACTPSMWAIVRYSYSTPSENQVQMLDIDMFDQLGYLCARFEGLSFRMLPSENENGATDQTVLAEPYWRELQENVHRERAPEYAKHVVLLIEFGENGVEDIQAELQRRSIRCVCVNAAPGRVGVEERFATCTAMTLEEIQRLTQQESKNTGSALLQVVISSEQNLYHGLSAMLKTASLEHASFVGQLIEISVDEEPGNIADMLVESSANPQHAQIRYTSEICETQAWKIRNRVEAADEDGYKKPLWRQNGVYLITGGAGGLGRIFAKEIARHAPHSTIIAAGRSSLPNGQQQIKELQASGINVIYRQADITDRNAVGILVTELKREFGYLHGIVHSAGIIHDAYLFRKTEEDVRKVLAPKVAGVIHLDEATKDVELDMFILCSAVAGVLGNPGQADYAAANAFMDAFAYERNQLVRKGQRSGRTLSINWPLWKEGGMQVSAEIQQMMRKRYGMSALETKDGVQALYEALNSGREQVMVLSGDLLNIEQMLKPEDNRNHVFSSETFEIHSSAAREEVAAVSSADIHQQAVQYVKQRLAGVIGLPESRIEADAPMEQYGIDSILIMQMTDELETDFGSLPKTLFFEYQTIRALSGYFIEAHSERLRSLLKEGKPGAASAVAQARAVAGKSGAKAAVQKRQPAVSEEPPFAARARAAAASGRRGSPWDTDLPLLGRPAFRRERLRVESHSPLAGGVVREAEQEIAIIGMAGRYPGARNVEQFWQNLRSGKDSITEIPTSRWDHRRYYDAAPGTAGKTYGQWGGFLDGVDEFDPLFFNVSPREAEMMDPQERLFMQCVYETLEDAGYTRESLSPQAVGVYVGVMYEEYQLYGAQSSIALSGNPSSIANRVSYFCNFRGPSMAVDTMCSSSLTAIHLACQSLRQQECGVAVAGGVNVSVHPNKYVMLAQGRFLSSKGRCESFGRGGDGYVPGEGVGAVLLKPLSRAVADGDRIYGVIKGSALNHGGKTNGYTVPNPKAQAEVIEQALKEAGIDARTISYVEAHGTGTSLGDPIEVAGLSKAFGGPAEKPYCAIGSAKSNIGHGESAAGIAGVTKVLLQMQHGELAPSLHAKETNPHIDFSRSPFTVQQELGPWERPVMEGERLPRRAGISSFGAGGANAHVIIEEYRETRPNQQAAETPERPVMIVLSAKSAERLKAQAEQLLEALQSGVYGGCTLADVGYTLQVGREALEERLGLLAESLEELTSKLQAYVEGADEGKATAGEGFFYRGQAKGGREALSVFAGEEEMQEMVSRWLQRGKYGKVLEVWTRGLAVNWLEQYGETEKHRPRRISLPTYPFVRDRYWMPEPGKQTDEQYAAQVQGGTPFLHPLLHSNTSRFSLQQYTTSFTGEEAILTDHRVNGRKILPGTAYLEMAGAAVQHASELSANLESGVKIQHVTWITPLIVNDKKDVHVRLHSEETGAVRFDIYSEPQSESDQGRSDVHCQGKVLLGAKISKETLSSKPWLSIAGERTMDRLECYAMFEQLGIVYGPAFQGIEHIIIQENQVWAHLKLPSAAAMDPLFILNPYLLDAALQAIIGLMLNVQMPSEKVEGTKKDAMPPMPFFLDEMEILRSCTTDMWVRIQPDDERDRKQGVIKLAFEMYNPDGELCVRMRKFSFKTQSVTAQAFQLPVPGTVTPPVGNVLLTPMWDVFTPEIHSPVPSTNEKVVIIGGNEWSRNAACRIYPRATILEVSNQSSVDELTEALVKCDEIRHIIWIDSWKGLVELTDESILVEQEQGVLQLFRLVKSLLGLGYGTRSVDWTVVTTEANPVYSTDEINPTHASIHGFIGSIAKEYSCWRIKLVDVENGTDWAGSGLHNLPADSQGNTYVYRSGEWYRQELVPVDAQKVEIGKISYRQEGVYVVIGGAGGIGEAWSEYMIRNYNARVVWIGRRVPDSRIRAKLDKLASIGRAPEYITADASDYDILQQAYEQIKQKYLKIHGIIHSAIVLRDQSIANMEEERFRAGLFAKVAVSVRLAQIFGEEPLDFMLFFSSFNAFTRSPGQSNYVAGCTFKDAFAHQLALERPYQVKVINWGYWGSVGSVASDSYNTRMNNAGIGSIETPEAMKALEILLAGPLDRLGFIKTTRPLYMKELSLEKVVSLN
ncbi:SDR family NAD(P)-dependent oxidoreductase [Paenibacillus durus]|uniref:SDR family NAD(P)-dependent oxidoreductase n=1 Tax=Paenibacillus durus TaxID=44251 RepID=UPI000693C6DE|nr:SDR family NAD(P)-dependent oxidoreductase [Paenibacillus durus]